MTRILIIILAYLLASGSLNSQTICSKSNLLQQWVFIRNSSPPSLAKLNPDSLKAFLSVDPYTVNTTIYKADGVREYATKTDTKTSFYDLDENTCKIAYRKRRKSRRTTIATINYLDDKYLVITIPRPHGLITYYYKAVGH